MKKEKEESQVKQTKSEKEYETPTMITYSEDELLEELGPIQACSGFGGSVLCP